MVKNNHFWLNGYYFITVINHCNQKWSFTTLNDTKPSSASRKRAIENRYKGENC